MSGGFAGEVNVVGGQAIGQCANLTDVSHDILLMTAAVPVSADDE